MWKIVQDILSIPALRRRLVWVFVLLAVYRVGFQIYLPGVDISALKDILRELQEKSGAGGIFQFLALTSQLTGGQLANATVFSLGIMPYISASIIFSLLVKVFPKMEALQKEGESGRQQINRYTRYSTLVLCVIQALFVVKFLHTPYAAGQSAISETGIGIAVLQVLVMTAGTIFLMWLGEKITEYGIGNGVSLIIMAGIIASMPGVFGELSRQLLTMIREGSEETPFMVLRILTLLGLFVGVVVGVVYITRAQRRIPIQQARTVKGRRVYGGQRHYMPIRVNSAGVLPIIFAQSLLMIPAGLVQWLMGTGSWFTDLFAYNSTSYNIFYVLMIGFFTYFWTSLMFNPVEISQNMKENGSFIPGIRPGKRTAEYLEHVLNRITLAGAVFLSAIAVVPQLMTDALNVQLANQFLGGTGILIVVGVALDLVDKIEAQLLVRQYEGFMKAGGPMPPGAVPPAQPPVPTGEGKGGSGSSS